MARPALSRLLALLAVLAATAVGAGTLWLAWSLPPREVKLVAAAVAAQVQVYRDRHGIPHIFAGSREDAALALGFVHAQDRLWQMEGMRRLASGRLSEVLGARTVEIDRTMRTLGFQRLAEAQYASSSAEVRRVLDAYAAGVNLWLAEHRGALPPEFLAVSHAPEEWRPADSLLWLRTMSLRLAGNRSEELLRERLSRILSAEMLGDLWPPAPVGSALTIPGATAPPSEDGGPAEGGPQDGGASNMWVVGGSRTRSGKPLLANDPHLGLTAPISWYLARVETPDGRIAGATAPGFPFFIFGHNDRIAWALTSTGSDVEDLVLERLSLDDPGRYLTEDGSEAFAVRSETIRVKGREDVVVEMRSTRHGPVIGELEPPTPEGETRLLALSASYLAEDDRAAEAALGVNAARSWDEFVAALSGQKVIQQNFGYADVDGNIGFIAPGRVPIRAPGQGRMPVPGWTGEAEAQGEIPFAALPRVFNPQGDVIINANNRIVDKSYPFYLGDGWDAGFRAERIAELIGTRTDHTVETMAAMQVDIVSPMAKTLLPLMLEPLEGDDSRESARSALRAWAAEPVMAPDRPEPLIFAAWLGTFVEEVGRDKLGPLFESWWGYRPLFAERVLRQRPVWCDRLATPEVEACAERLREALARAMAELSRTYGDEWRGWRWDAAHEARFTHQALGQAPVLGRLVNVTTRVGGGNDTILRAASNVSDAEAPFAAIHGAGFRGIYDLADLGRSRFIIAPGQSGNPLSIHYRDLIRLWRDGGSVILAQPREALARDAFSRLVLVPSAAAAR
ncbi:MAG: penicillin acylase family protein [Rhodospirillales bacterium]